MTDSTTQVATAVTVATGVGTATAYGAVFTGMYNGYIIGEAVTPIPVVDGLIGAAIGGLATYWGIDVAGAIANGFSSAPEVIPTVVKEAVEEVIPTIVSEVIPTVVPEVVPTVVPEVVPTVIKKAVEEVAKAGLNVTTTDTCEAVLQSSIPVVDYAKHLVKPVVVDTCTSAFTPKPIVDYANVLVKPAPVTIDTCNLADAPKVVEKVITEAASKGMIYNTIYTVSSRVASVYNPVHSAVANGYSQYAEPMISSIPYVGSTANDAIKLMGSNKLLSAIGAYKLYSAYGIITSANLTVKQKALAVAEAALPLAARPIAEAIVASTGTQQSVEMIQLGVMLAPTALRVTAGVVKGTGKALTFAYGKCCGKAAVEKQAAVELPVANLEEQPANNDAQPQLVIAKVEAQANTGLVKSPSRENLLQAAKGVSDAVQNIVNVVATTQTPQQTEQEKLNDILRRQGMLCIM